MARILLLATLWLLAGCAQAQVVAEVGGKPVDAAELVDHEPGAMRGEAARARVAMPAIAAYLAAHRDEWELSPVEADVALAGFRRALACDPNYRPDDDAERSPWIAKALASGEKAQRFIHQRFGGGRLLFQQAGVEAYDATYRLLLHLEREGAFVVYDPRVRGEMLSYWVDDNASHLFLPGDDWAEPYDPAASFITCGETASSDEPSARR
jgi:hypothetical protein